MRWSFSYKEHMLKHLFFQWPITSDQVRESVLASIEDGDWGAYHGKYTSQLIADLKQLLSVDHVVSVSYTHLTLPTILLV